MRPVRPKQGLGLKRAQHVARPLASGLLSYMNSAVRAQSKLLVYPLISPVVVPYIIPSITPFKELRLWLISETKDITLTKVGGFRKAQAGLRAKKCT